VAWQVGSVCAASRPERVLDVVVPVGIAVAAGREERVKRRVRPVRAADGIVEFSNRYTAVEMCSDVVGFGWRGFVCIAADVAVEVALGQLCSADDYGNPSTSVKSWYVATIFSSCWGRSMFCARPSRYSQSA
jgi:hypothetical protein